MRSLSFAAAFLIEKRTALFFEVNDHLRALIFCYMKIYRQAVHAHESDGSTADQLSVKRTFGLSQFPAAFYTDTVCIIHL